MIKSLTRCVAVSKANLSASLFFLSNNLRCAEAIEMVELLTKEECSITVDCPDTTFNISHVKGGFWKVDVHTNMDTKGVREAFSETHAKVIMANREAGAVIRLNQKMDEAVKLMTDHGYCVQSSIRRRVKAMLIRPSSQQSSTCSLVG